MSIFRTRLSPWLACALVASLLLALVPTSAEGQVEVEFPVIALDDVDGGFFVLASDVPYQVSMTEPEIAWFAVETAEGPSTEPRIVSLSSNSAGLAPGTYYSAVRIDLTTTQGPRAIFVPVAMDVPAASQAEMALSAMAAGVPAGLAQMQIDHPGLDVRFQLTPARHYIVEVVDTEQELLRVQGLAQAASQMPRIQAASQTYEHVFPWMCLEVCGPNADSEISDVAPNLDAVNGISYERYEMVGGSWGLLRTTDHGPWASQHGLMRWPMLIGGYHPTQASVQAMWNNRVTILNNLIAEANANGYEGYTVDVEGTADEGRTTFIALVDYLADGLHAAGFKLMVAHATWATLAPMADLARTSVDYVATMDPYTGWWNRYIPADYAGIAHQRLIWGFTWGGISDATQSTMWNWMEANGYNVDVAGAAVWRTPLMPPHGSNTLDYYVGLRRFYPINASAPTAIPTPTSTDGPTPTATASPTETATPTATITPTPLPPTSPPPTSPPPEHAVANADFEQGFTLAGGGYIANNWAEWEYNPGAITGYDETVTVHGGAHSQRLRVWRTGGGSGGAYQQVPVASGTSYTVGVQTRAYDTLSYCSLGVDPSGGTDFRSGVIWSSRSNSTSWVQQTWTGTATSNTLTIYLRAASVEGAKRNCYFDDVTLVLGPPPTPAPPEEAIGNADFEQGFTLAGGGYIANRWAEWEYNPGAITGYDETLVVHGGAHSQRIRVWRTGGGSGGAYQQIPVVSGSAYTVSIQARAYDTWSHCSLGVDPSGGIDPRTGVIWSSSTNSTSWVQHTWTGTATANSLTIYLRAAATDSSKRNCYFDDVAVARSAAVSKLAVA